MKLELELTDAEMFLLRSSLEAQRDRYSSALKYEQTRVDPLLGLADSLGNSVTCFDSLLRKLPA